ncbi:MAG: hypothetical protein ACOCXX_05380, partial [Planctomycetota bacterium]
MRRVQPLALILTLGCLASSTLAADLSLQKDDDAYVLENRFLKVRIVADGGKVASFYDKVARREYTRHPRAKGLGTGSFKDRVWETKSLNEVVDARHSLRVIRQTPEAVTVETSTTGTRAPIKKVEFTKQYTLRAGANRLEVTYRIFPHDVRTEFSPWLHNLIMQPTDPNDKNGTWVICQTERGLYNVVPRKSGASANILFDPSEPWVGLLTTTSATGVVQVCSLDKLNHFMCWLRSPTIATLEIIYKKNTFNPDAVWSTEVSLAATRGLKAYHFATRDYVGGFFRRGDQTVVGLFPTVDLGTATLTVRRAGKELASGKVELASGALATLPCELGPGMHTLEITVKTDDGEQVHRVRAASTLLKTEAQSVNDLQARKDEKPNQAYVQFFKDSLYVSPDMATVAAFFVRHTFKESRPDVRIVLEVPEGVTVEPTGKHTTEKITLEGTPYTRITIPSTRRAYAFLQTDWPAGRKGTAYLYPQFPGGEPEKRKLAVESITIGSAPRPKRLMTSLGWYGVGLWDAWPNFFEDYGKLGLNTLSTLRWDQFDNIEGLRKRVDQARRHGYWVAGNYSPWLDRKFTAHVKRDGALAVNLQGEPSSRYMCPSYRGGAFRAEVERISDFGSAGITQLWYDAEVWGGAEYCFCPRCIKGFKAYLAEHHPKLDYVDPRTVEAAPEEHAELHRIWIDEFRISLGTEMYRILRNRYHEKIAAAKAFSSPFVIIGSYGMMPGSIYHQFQRFDEQYAIGALNICMPSCYVAGDATRVADKIDA